VQPPIQDFEGNTDRGEKKTVGRGRFDINQQDSNLPEGDEEGGGFF